MQTVVERGTLRSCMPFNEYILWWSLVLYYSDKSLAEMAWFAVK